MIPAAKALTVALALSALTPAATAEDKILFLGNSFTIGGTRSVPVIFDALAVAGGHEDPTTVMRAQGGQDFEYHTTNATSQQVIASQQWTHVVMQNFSTEPTHIGSPAHHYQFGTVLHGQILANRADTRIFLYQTWARAANHPLISGTSTAATFASTAEMQSELRTHYAGLADALNAANPDQAPVLVAPVGDAWENAGGLLPEADPRFTDLHGGDNYHANDNGYFLAAAVIYSTIYGVSPEGLHGHAALTALNLNLTEDPAMLERVAWDTVSPEVAPVILTHPASVTVDANQSVTFTAEARGSRPLSARWFENGEEIPAATGPSHTIPQVTPAMDGSEFTVVFTNDVSSSAPSRPAVLSVASDEQPPEPIEATWQDEFTLILVFSEPLAPGPATDAAAFTIVSAGRRIAVAGATLSPQGTVVTLTTAERVPPGFVVALDSSLEDLSGNALAEGVLLVSSAPGAAAATLLIDFGGNGSRTGGNWNNVDTTVGTTNTGTLAGLRDTGGEVTAIGLEMVRRFNGANSNGTTAGAAFPSSASSDSLFGNTELFAGLSNIFPAFRLVGLDPGRTYGLEFYASRLGVTDNRQTLYTVTGDSISTATLNAADNVDSSANLSGVSPTTAGTLTIELSAGTENNNGNQFTYLGVLVVTAEEGAPAAFHPLVRVGGHLVLDWLGNAQLQENADLSGDWTPVIPAPAPPHVVPIDAPFHFFRLAYPD